MVANKSREYFRAGISLSASGYNTWGLYNAKQAKFWTNWLADVVQCPSTKSSYALVECFRQKNPAYLVGKTAHIFVSIQNSQL
jgi:hypothetical protein